MTSPNKVICIECGHWRTGHSRQGCLKQGCWCQVKAMEKDKFTPGEEIK